MTQTQEVRGTDDYSGLSIEENLQRRGAMTLLLRVSQSMWDDRGWPFRLRVEASKIPIDCWELLWVEKWGGS